MKTLLYLASEKRELDGVGRGWWGVPPYHTLTRYPQTHLAAPL